MGTTKFSQIFKVEISTPLKIVLETLLDCGYQGPCKDARILSWAIRLGAASDFYLDLIKWLEVQLSNTKSTVLVNETIKKLLQELSRSVLMRKHDNTSPYNAKKYRLNSLKVLLQHLKVNLTTQLNAASGDTCSPSKDLRITINVSETSSGMELFHRTVRYHPTLMG